MEISLYNLLYSFVSGIFQKIENELKWRRKCYTAVFNDFNQNWQRFVSIWNHIIRSKRGLSGLQHKKYYRFFGKRNTLKKDYILLHIIGWYILLPEGYVGKILNKPIFALSHRQPYCPRQQSSITSSTSETWAGSGRAWWERCQRSWTLPRFCSNFGSTKTPASSLTGIRVLTSV